jgi:hypothetical protein
MDTNRLLASIDSEIATLQQVRALLTGQKGHARLGRKRVLSAEGRARIAEAQRKRWAKQRRAAKRAA